MEVVPYCIKDQGLINRSAWYHGTYAEEGHARSISYTDTDFLDQ